MPQPLVLFSLLQTSGNLWPPPQRARVIQRYTEQLEVGHTDVVAATGCIYIHF